MLSVNNISDRYDFKSNIDENNEKLKMQTMLYFITSVVCFPENSIVVYSKLCLLN